MTNENNDPRIIVACDVPTLGDAIALATKLDPSLCRIKVGKELFTAVGPTIVEKIQELGFEIFLDLKFHDIPNTVAGAVKVAANLGVWMVNVHAGGGRLMMEAAANSVANFQVKPSLIGVTVLTSLDESGLSEVGVNANPAIQAGNLAKLALECGLNGVVCSGQEAEYIRSFTSASFLLVTPGIRLPDGNKDDQVRIVTPEMAIKSGSSYLVVGRPITGATDPLSALQTFHQRAKGVIAGLRKHN